MASYRKIVRKDGSAVYEISVSRGRDPVTKKQLSPYTMRYTPPATWSNARIEREVLKVATKFENECKTGNVKTRKELKKEEEERRIAEEKAANEAYDPTFNEYAARQYELLPVRLKYPTKKLYRQAWDLMRSDFGEQKVSGITRDNVISWIKNGLSGNFTKGTIELYYSKISYLLDTAVEDGLLAVNPLPPKKKLWDYCLCKDKRKQMTVDQETVERIYREREQISADSNAVNCFIFLAETGCRIGEAIVLEWSDVDLEEGTVSVTKTIQTAEKGYRVSLHTKTGSDRIVYISRVLASLLRDEKQKRPSSRFVFENTRHTHYTPDVIRAIIKRIGMHFGLDEEFHPHSLRHTFATLLLSEGTDVATVGSLLGHASPVTTLSTYSHAVDKARKKAAQDFHRGLVNESGDC